MDEAKIQGRKTSRKIVFNEFYLNYTSYNWVFEDSVKTFMSKTLFLLLKVWQVWVGKFVKENGISHSLVFTKRMKTLLCKSLWLNLLHFIIHWIMIHIQGLSSLLEFVSTLFEIFHVKRHEINNKALKMFLIMV